MKKLKLNNYLGYMSGDIGNNLAFSLQGMFLLIYYTNVVGLNPAPIGTMFLVVRLWDAFADLIAGRIVDVTRTRWGKFRPYLLVASLPLLLCSVAVFTMPSFGGDRALQYVYAYASYALLGFLYSLVNIPYGSLATVMTQDPVERARLGTWRTVGPMVTILAIVVIVAPQIQRLKANPAALQSFFTWLTLGFVVLGYLMYFLCFANCRENIAPSTHKVTFGETIKTVRTNKPLLILCLSNFVFLIGVFAIQGAQAYFASYVLGNASLMVWMVLATTLSTFVGVPLVPRLVAKVGKKNTFFIGAAGFILIGVWIFFMPNSFWVMIVTFFILGIFQNISMSLLFAFEADAVEYGEYTTGERTEGATYAVYSFFRKVSQAVAGAAVAYALSIGGFNAKLPVQTPEALTAIRAVVGLGPAIFGIIGATMFLAYPLTDAKFRELVAEVRTRREASASDHDAVTAARP